MLPPHRIDGNCPRNSPVVEERFGIERSVSALAGVFKGIGAVT